MTTESIIHPWALCFTFLEYYVIACLVVYILIIAKIFPTGTPPSVLNQQTILLITAHPDDECMFFSPAIIELAKSNSVHVLCTTTGNYYGQGHVRTQELSRSCETLGISSSNVQVLDSQNFPDGSNVLWDEGSLREEVENVITSIKPSVILIFDNYGVSGHPNHITTGQVVRKMYLDGCMFSNTTRVYELESVSLLRKYISMLDLPWAILSGRMLFVSSLTAVFQAQRAMFCHSSQLVWFRYLYIVFSRYMVINTLVQVAHDKADRTGNHGTFVSNIYTTPSS